MIQKFDWEKVSAIGTCVGALATFCACFIALWQTKYNNRKKIKVYFSDNINLIHPTIAEDEREYVGVTIINEGNRKVTITGLSFELENKMKAVIILNYNKPYITQLPVTVEPEQKIELLYDRKFFYRNVLQCLKEKSLKKNKKIKFSISDATGKNYFFYSNKKADDYKKIAEANKIRN